MPSDSSVEARPHARARSLLLLRAHALCCSACPFMRVARLKTFLNAC